MTGKNAFIAMCHFYFCTSVLQEIADRGIDSGDLTGVGEDVFIVEMYPYSNLLRQHIDVLESDPTSNWTDSKLFDVCNNLAAFFVDAIERQDTTNDRAVMPELDEFHLDIQRVLQTL
ncbi:hypothetical protein QUN99_003438 [Vibrio parahaemolyticus]|nr:hypothetical protein [Vibrio parahaemolyticus]